ncbi:MAG: hypothetical protein EHM64_00135 [Ignavibacteriae bacterium]|nr:MAG: hypothetical protein EHM64_00135 [Ignavibacteriota bacterium]
MAIGVFSPTVPSKASDIMLGEGVIYKNYGTENLIIGATRGGSKLIIEKPIKEIKYDGAYGPTKQMRRVDTYLVKLVVNFLKLTYTNLAYGLPITVSDGADKDGTYKKIAFDLEIAAADVVTNITFKGLKMDGTSCLIKVLNALNIDNISLEFKEKDEVVSEMTYTGFYAAATPTDAPLEIWDYVV